MLIVFSIFLISLIFYLASLLVFMSTLNNLNQIRTVPNIDTLIDFDLDNNSFDELSAAFLSV
ncbi:MAG: hypothetical protein Q4Q37_05395 [Methanobrevibacter sp.]|nr:hypothetical protein [Methanobrevibacter sp.]